MGWGSKGGGDTLVTKALTDNTATGLFEVTLASGARAGGTIAVTVESTDDTDHQARKQLVIWSAVNKGGVYTTDVQVITDAVSLSSGTLGVTWDVLAGTNKVTIRVTANTSLTPTALNAHYVHHNESAQTVTGL